MYRIKTADKTLYTDAIRYVRLHKNGCYVACLDDVAEGICAKVHERMEEVGTVLQDTVFALTEGAMHGTEAVCLEIEADFEATTALLQDGQDAQDTQAILLRAHGQPTTAEAKHYRKVIELAMQTIEDEVALTSVTLFPEWVEGVGYDADMRVKHGDILYRCLSPHTSQLGWEPDVAVSLWAKVLIPDETMIYPWEQPESTNPYKKGDKVTHNGKTWVSNMDYNVFEPGVAGWDEVTE